MKKKPANKKPKPIIIGAGVLNWARAERISDRYGIVFLQPLSGGYMNAPTSEAAKEFIPVVRQHEGKRGKLVAIVQATRESGHIGDLFHGIGPRTPKVGQRITLGEGTLWFEPVEGVKELGVGVRPAVEENPWMNMRSLYDCHDQTVQLVFIRNGKET